MILGLDPGLANCGWALVTRSRDVVEVGCVRTTRDKDATGDAQRRLVEITAALAPLITRAVAVVIEWPSAGGFGRSQHGGNVIAATQTNLVAGLAFGLAAAHNRPISAPAAITWRSVLGHKRGRDEQLHADLLVRYRAELERVRAGDLPHVLDAIGLGLYRVELADRARNRASRQLALPT